MNQREEKFFGAESILFEFSQKGASLSDDGMILVMAEGDINQGGNCSVIIHEDEVDRMTKLLAEERERRAAASDESDA